MRTQYKMRSKLVASVAAAAMAASMVVAVPGAAFATYDTGGISAKTTSAINTTVGSQVDMADYFTYSASGGDGAWHVDYKVTDGSAATVNKHSGKLTASAEGDVEVTAYLTDIATPQQQPTNPCEETDVTATVTVHVNAADSYGYQGDKLGIKMTSPTVTAFSGSNSEGWINTVSGATETDGVYYFTIAMNNGFKTYNTAKKFAARNAGNISVVTSSATATLDSENESVVFIDSVDINAKTIVVGIDSSAVATEGTQLVFASGFRGNNDSNTLGTTVTFSIN